MEYTAAVLYGINQFNEKIKKPVGMMKLLNLLNEYQNVKENGYKWENNWWELVEIDEEYLPVLAYEYNWFHVIDKEAIAILISKQYGFIRWLVDSDRIDFDRLKISYIYHDEEWDREKELLMQLAIADNPITDLLFKILK